MITVKRINMYRKNGNVISIPSKSLRLNPLVSCTGNKISKISLNFKMSNIQYNWKEKIDSKKLIQILKEEKDITHVELENSNKRTCFTIPFNEKDGKNIGQFLLSPTEDSRLRDNNYLLIFS